jgi:aspartyl-tRNA(Asn)/glutamyl-tRNA(Gln) amidotransferase subunit B
MRSKEEAHDYRYFPDPDLPPLHIDQDLIDTVRKSMPEMPDQAAQRLIKHNGLSQYDADLITQSPQNLKFFDETLALYHDAKAVSNWMMGDLTRLLNQNGMEIQDAKIKPALLAEMLQLLADGTISGKMAKTVFEEMFASGKDAKAIIEEKGLVQISDTDSLLPLLDEIINNNPKVLQDYKNGKEKAFGFFVGQIMKATKGQANPEMVNNLLRERLNRE